MQFTFQTKAIVTYSGTIVLNIIFWLFFVRERSRPNSPRFHTQRTSHQVFFGVNRKGLSPQNTVDIKFKMSHEPTEAVLNFILSTPHFTATNFTIHN